MSEQESATADREREIRGIIESHGQFTTKESTWRCKCGIGGSEGTTHREHLVSVFAAYCSSRERAARKDGMRFGVMLIDPTKADIKRGQEIATELGLSLPATVSPGTAQRPHEWTGYKRGGDPADSGSVEYVRYCKNCGMEDTCEEPMPSCGENAISNPAGTLELAQEREGKLRAALENAVASLQSLWAGVGDMLYGDAPLSRPYAMDVQTNCAIAIRSSRAALESK